MKSTLKSLSSTRWKRCNLKTAVVKSLKTLLVDQREQFENFEATALRIDGVEQEFRHGERKKKRKLFADETRTNDVSEDMSAREKFIKFTFYQTIDNIYMSSEENRCIYSCVRIICLFVYFSENDVDRLVAEYPND